MGKEIKELYIQLLKRGRTIDDLVFDNKIKFDFITGYIDLCGFPVETKFEMKRAYADLLTLVYPDQQWE